jgi:hypothetical protein
MYAVATLIILHSLAGAEITINPKLITVMKSSDPNKPNQYVAGGANCAISMSDGKFITVKEHCNEVRKLIDGR